MPRFFTAPTATKTTARVLSARLLLTACTLGGLISTSAWAQWQWLDEHGRKTFSDRPPPTHIPPAQILQRPASTAGQADYSALPRVPEEEAEAPAEAQEQAPTPAPSTPAPNKPTEPAAPTAQEREQQAQAQRQQAAQRQDNCRRAQAALRTLQSSSALAQVNEQGQRTTMSSAQRQQEITRTQQQIARYCTQQPTPG